MKKLIILGLAVAGIGMTSCKKCSECHYDINGAEVELGEKCGDELEDLEKSGFTVNGVNYEVHCHAH